MRRSEGVIRWGRLFSCGALGCLAWGCLLAAAETPCPIRLRDVTERTGISFVHTDGSSGRRYIVETVCCGLALLDYDRDGDVDVYFLNGAPLPGTKVPVSPKNAPPKNALYRNDGNWKFTDVTERAGVGDTGYGLGVCAGDYDNDGDLDIYLNNFGPNVLYRNNGNGTFTDVTKRAGVAAGNQVGAGACFLDMDQDGDLDLYVSNYVAFTYQKHQISYMSGFPAYVGPLNYPMTSDVLYRNNGNGTFTDVSAASGVGGHSGPGMGMICADYDDDGDTDIVVGNDLAANFVFQNDGSGRFEEVGLLAGLAYDLQGTVHGTMGVECADWDHDGRLDFYMTSYQRQLATLYRNLADGSFEDVTRQAGAAAGTYSQVTWGTGMPDLDNDGDRDIFIACGHLIDNVDRFDGTTSYHARNIVLMNGGKGKFVDVSKQCGDGLAPKLSSRGAVFDDLDNDGDIDVVILNSRRKPTLLKNDSAGGNHWIGIRLRGTKTNRDGVGARVEVTAGDLTQIDEVHSGRSYQSDYGKRLHFGLGSRNNVEQIKVRWIGGGVDVVRNVGVDRVVTIVEGSGLIPTSQRTNQQSLITAGGAQCPIQLRDVTQRTGISFVHTDGSSGRRYIVETVCCGLALLDYDRDGDVDVYFLNGAPLPGTKVAVPPKNALYRNDGNWKFTDVTERAGVGDTGYGLGVCAGDYDGDGDLDLYLNNFGPNVLYRNNGNGTFTDVTKQAGVGNGRRVGAGACFLDMDKDGDLDLYVSNYVAFTYQKHRTRLVNGFPAYVGPMQYGPVPDTLYRNEGNGTFTDVSAESGIAAHAGTGMGMICADYDDDDDTDIVVGNDAAANFVFQNDGSGKFQEVGLLAGLAYDLHGIGHGTMGVECGDYNNDGRLDFQMTSYHAQLATLYENLGPGLFEDVTRRTHAGTGTFSAVTWGNGLVDFDNDGDRDLFIACGHLQDNILRWDNTKTYSTRNLLLMNDGNGKFVNVSDQCGDGLAAKLSSRGAAFDDLDNDGDVDVVVLNSRRRPTILRNDSPPTNHWIQVRLCGTKGNREGVGARVKLTAGDLVQVDEVHSGRGYQSHYGLRLHFGLGRHDHVDRIEVRWIGGGVDVLENVQADRLLTVTESSGRAESRSRHTGQATQRADDRRSGN